MKTVLREDGEASMSAYADAFRHEVAAAIEALDGQLGSRQIEGPIAVTGARLEAQEARLGELEATMRDLVQVHNGR